MDEKKIISSDIGSIYGHVAIDCCWCGRITDGEPEMTEELFTDSMLNFRMKEESLQEEFYTANFRSESCYPLNMDDVKWQSFSDVSLIFH